jgi:hypothetical protein
LITNHSGNLKSVIKPITVKNEAIAKRQLEELLFDAVEKQLISDVPGGHIFKRWCG